MDKNSLEDIYYPWTSATHKDGLKIYGYEEGQITLCDTQIKQLADE